MSDVHFADVVARVYDQLLVPMIFEPYARDLVARVEALPSSSLLEVAAGTGAVTRQLAARLPESTVLVATDLNQPMLDEAARAVMARPVRWQRADVTQLPFDAGSFDVVVCQFGVMFFPDRVRAHSEVRRVLKPGGVFVFNTWDRLAANEFPAVVDRALSELYPSDPAHFIARIPHGYFDPRTIRDDLAGAGFTALRRSRPSRP